MVRILLCLIGLLLSQNVLALTQVTATIDKNPVHVNESLILEVVADDDVDNNALDTSALTRDFIVGNTSVSSQTSMINFKTTRSTTWTTVLIPRHDGEVIIPALKVADKQSSPIALVVLKADNSAAAKAQQDVFIKTQTSANEVYVQQQFTLTVQLYLAAELKRGSLTEPTLDGATITQIGKDQESQQIVNGRRFRVIERSYAVNPQQSGQFTLTSPMFSGEIMTSSSRRSMFLSFADSKPVSVVGDEIAITVKPIPGSFKGQWLPSELLTLHDEWQPSGQTFKVGEPITRTLTITGTGLSEEQLPQITMQLPAGLKVYPDQAENHTNINGGKLVGQKVQNFAIVASKPGQYQLPAITIPWWNTITNRYQQAVLPATSITVLPSDNPAPVAVAATAPDSTATNTPVQTLVVTQNSWLQWLFLALWLGTSFAWFGSYMLGKRQHKRTNTTRAVNNNHLLLIKACKQNDGEQALNLLLPWLNGLGIFSRPVTSLDEALSQLNEPAFSTAVADLQRCYFAKHNEIWQGKDLLACIGLISKNKGKQHDNAEFSLNP